MLLLICFAFLSSVYTVCGNPILVEGQTPELTHQAILDSNDLVTLRWRYNDTYIVFRLEVTSTSGWIGFGVSPNANMAGSDLAVMWIENGAATIMDMHAEANELPTKDVSQDVYLIDGETSDGKTIFTFGRRLKACEEKDNDISENTLRILWAYGPNKPTGGELTASNKHESNARGSRSLRLLSAQLSFDPSAAGQTTVDFLFTDVAIKPQVTHYHCRIQKLVLGGKKHVLQFSPVVESGNELFVHHMLVYLCAGISNYDDGNGNECQVANMPAEYSKCPQLIYAWAIGGGAFTFPDDVGFPLDDSNAEVYLFTEIHYDNQNRVSGRTDSSGFKLTYTNNLKSKEAGILQIGSVVNQMHYVPAKVKDWRTYAECSSTCLSTGFTQDSVKVFAVILHAHLFGIKLRLHHYRNGVELKPLTTEEFYDFNYQEYNFLINEVDFKKGDTLGMECIYDTMGRDQPVYGGLGTEEEMCLAFIYTYPKINILQCTSVADLGALSTFMGIDSTLLVTDQTAWTVQWVQTTGTKTFDLAELREAYNSKHFYEACDTNGIAQRAYATFTAYEEEPAPQCPSGFVVRSFSTTSILLGFFFCLFVI